MRIKNIIYTDLLNQKLMVQETIERVMNDHSLDVVKQRDIIIEQLEELVQLDSMLNKWREIIGDDPESFKKENNE